MAGVDDDEHCRWVSLNESLLALRRMSGCGSPRGAQAAKRAGVGRVSPHRFRHTCGSLLFEHGSNINQVQEWLGHHGASVTLRVYIHLVDRGVGTADFFDEVTGIGDDSCPRFRLFDLRPDRCA